MTNTVQLNTSAAKIRKVRDFKLFKNNSYCIRLTQTMVNSTMDVIKTNQT